MQAVIPLTEVTSAGEKDNSSDAVKVPRRDSDGSCLEAAVTIAWQRVDLRGGRNGESRVDIMRMLGRHSVQ